MLNILGKCEESHKNTKKMLRKQLKCYGNVKKIIKILIYVLRVILVTQKGKTSKI